MNRRRRSALAPFRALYIAAIAVFLLGAFGVVFVPKLHAAPAPVHPLHLVEHAARVAGSSDAAPIAGLLGIGCLSLAGLLALNASRS